MLAKFADDMEIFIEWSTQSRDFFVAIHGEALVIWTRDEMILFRNRLNELLEETG